MQYTCPISKKQIDENVVRLIGFFTLILLIISFFITKIAIFIFIFIIFDFYARIFIPKFSILKIISKIILHKIIKIKPKPIGAAPKRFAAGIGLLLSVIIFFIIFFYKPNWNTQNTLPTNFYIEIIEKTFIIIFAIAVSLETFFKFCLGCKIYSWIQYFKNKK